MRSIEKRFQALADLIEDGLDRLSTEQSHTATEYWALWRCRHHLKHHPSGDKFLKGVTGEDVTLDQQEILESKWTAFAGSDGNMPGRMLAGSAMQVNIDRVVMQFKLQWGVIRATEGEFLHPDTFRTFAILPINPSVQLQAGNEAMTITRLQVATSNACAIGAALEFVFAMDFAKCPSA